VLSIFVIKVLLCFCHFIDDELIEIELINRSIDSLVNIQIGDRVSDVERHYHYYYYYYRGAVNAGWSSREKGVCPSVCLSVYLPVKCVDCDKTKEKFIQIFITYESSFINPSFLRRRMVCGGRPLLPEILSQPATVGVKSLILNRYSLCAFQ